MTLRAAMLLWMLKSAKCLAALCLLALLLAGCSTNSKLPQDRADRFTGAPLTNFGGADGASPALQAIARQLCDAREYDFTATGFQISPNTAATTQLGLADPRFASGSGIILFPDETNNIGSVNFAITSNDSDITTVTLGTSFEVRQAQNAINTPGIAFGVHWRIHFTLQGVVHDLTADQLLRGVDFRSI